MPSDIEWNEYVQDNCVLKVIMTLREYANIFGNEAAVREYMKQYGGELLENLQ